jgi:hypothetical protein
LDLEVLQEAFIYFLHGVRPSDPVFPLRLGWIEWHDGQHILFLD